MSEQYLAVVTETGGHTVISPVHHVGGGPIRGRPVDPGYGQGHPLPPHVGGGPVHPPETVWPPPVHPDNELPGGPPPHGPGGGGEHPDHGLPGGPPPTAGHPLPEPPTDAPPGTVWPPLDPGQDLPDMGSDQWVIVWLPGIGYRFMKIEGKPIHEPPAASPKPA
jgi:hypothetical protein